MNNPPYDYCKQLQKVAMRNPHPPTTFYCIATVLLKWGHSSSKTLKRTTKIEEYLIFNKPMFKLQGDSKVVPLKFPFTESVSALQ